ncbi:hypothetical protein BDV23DRAFT_188318 [Aspergillus alliaceus]|uniref:Uncharacterized protein n=1 Tax=Petromyces alliaceus TaxID=209559 RepID=A0A5N7BUD7_PETAA|nr:hypothetical protein BDV23DRAFT_188318 [Aspergillus alliaceus]
MAKSEIPALLGVKGTTVTEGEKEKSPAAVILGGGYTQTDLEEIRAASQGEGAKTVAWVKVDPTKSPPSLPVGPEYGRAVAKRTKDRLDELVRSGKMNRDEVHLI